ncbi:MAG TPA: hypothetical protein PKA94_12805, partial [Ferruginibacter sp.]|nr:hypothetical protein [Ferruginibacter sp.]
PLFYWWYFLSNSNRSRVAARYYIARSGWQSMLRSPIFVYRRKGSGAIGSFAQNGHMLIFLPATNA